MPYYEVNHCQPLTSAQQDALAASITHIHSRLFSTPTLFVHVRFTDNSIAPVYLAGKRRRTNVIFANVRHGPSRTKEHYSKLCEQVGDAWKAAIAQDANGRANGYVQTAENKLNAIFVMGSILTGWEGGFMIPDAGKDKEWFRENLGEMEKVAKDGDDDMKEMLEEIKTRDEFKDLFA